MCSLFCFVTHFLSISTPRFTSYVYVFDAPSLTTILDVSSDVHALLEGRTACCDSDAKYFKINNAIPNEATKRTILTTLSTSCSEYGGRGRSVRCSCNYCNKMPLIGTRRTEQRRPVPAADPAATPPRSADVFVAAVETCSRRVQFARFNDFASL